MIERKQRKTKVLFVMCQCDFWEAIHLLQWKQSNKTTGNDCEMGEQGKMGFLRKYNRPCGRLILHHKISTTHYILK